MRFGTVFWWIGMIGLCFAGVVIPMAVSAQELPGDLQLATPADGSNALSLALEVPAFEGINNGGALRRTTIVPWWIEVLGKNYESFPNNEAARVLSDWLVNSLISLQVFNVVNRDKIQAVLSEQQMANSGYTEEISPMELASAGKMLKVDYILFGNFKNLGRTSEIDFKLLDVDTATYTQSINFTIPFNAEIESMKPEIDRISGALAERFPLHATIREVLDDQRLVVSAGTNDGLGVAMEVELWHPLGSEPLERGFIVRATEDYAEIELAKPFAYISLFDHHIRIKIVPPAQAALAKGLKELEDGHYEQAVRTFERGLEADPNDGLLHANYARSIWLTQNAKAAIPAFRKALELRPEDLELHEEAAEAMLAAGEYKMLIESFDDDQSERSPILRLAYGHAHEIQGQLDQARDIYRQVVRNDPDNARAHFRLAVLATKRGEMDEASREMRTAHGSIDEGSRGIANERRGATRSHALEISLGAQTLELVLAEDESGRERLSPLIERAAQEHDIAALASAGELTLGKPSLWGLGLDLAQQILQLQPSYLRAIILKAHAFAAGGQAVQAIRLIDETLESHPDSLPLVLLSGRLLTEQENFLGAEQHLRHAKDLAPEDWRPAAVLGDIYAQQSDHLKAVSEYMDALERAELRNVPAVDLLFKLGRAAIVANQYATAQPYLERCVATSPDHTQCHYYLGLCYFNDASSESAEKAIASFKAATSIANSLYYLGQLYERRRELAVAKGWYKSCVDAEGCHFAVRSQSKIDHYESITGTVSGLRDGGKKVALDVGRLHGVTHDQEAAVVHGGQLVGRVKVEEVQELMSVAKIVKGEPLIGQTVRIRPSRPKGLDVMPAPKKGVLLKWRPNPEAEVDAYQVMRASSPKGPWKPAKKVREALYNDRSPKSGETVYYKIAALARHGAQSLETETVSIEVP